MSVQQGPLDLRELGGSTCVVTGCANGGIGWGLAKHAASLGMDVALVDLHEHLVERAGDQLVELYPHSRAVAIQCDVADEESVAACAAAVERELPGQRIGACFANAGVIFNKTVLRSSIEDFRLTFNVNVMGVVNCMQAFVPLMQRSELPSLMVSTASIG